MGLKCGSIRQESAITGLRRLLPLVQESSRQEELPQSPSDPSQTPSVAAPPSTLVPSENSVTPTRSSATEPLKPQQAFIRGNLTHVRPTRATPQDLAQYSELIKANPGTFGLRALMKIATSDTAPRFAAPNDYQTFLSWKTSWESLFATHIIDNPKIQVQIATLTLQGEARDWWNAYWADNPHQDITWTWFTDLVRATFYPLEAQENAFTVWSELEYKDDVPAFFEKIRRKPMIIPYPHDPSHINPILPIREILRGANQKQDGHVQRD